MRPRASGRDAAGARARVPERHALGSGRRPSLPAARVRPATASRGRVYDAKSGGRDGAGAAGQCVKPGCSAPDASAPDPGPRRPRAVPLTGARRELARALPTLPPPRWECAAEAARRSLSLQWSLREPWPSSVDAARSQPRPPRSPNLFDKLLPPCLVRKEGGSREWLVPCDFEPARGWGTGIDELWELRAELLSPKLPTQPLT